MHKSGHCLCGTIHYQVWAIQNGPPSVTAKAVGAPVLRRLWHGWGLIPRMWNGAESARFTNRPKSQPAGFVAPAERR